MSIGALAGLGFCDRDAAETWQIDRPPVQAVAISPSQGEQGVGRERALRVRFDRFLRPTSVVRQSVSVNSGLIDSKTGNSTVGDVFFAPVYDPYERVVSFRLMPWQRWLPEVLYTANIVGPKESGQVFGIQAFDGAPLAEPLRYHFVSGKTVSEPERDVDDAWPTIDFCTGATGELTLPAPSTVLAQACGSCHGQDAAVGLALTSARELSRTAIGVVARQTRTGPWVGEASKNPVVFGDSMARIEPMSPGASYLIYKLLINEGNYASGEDADHAKWNGGLPWIGGPGAAEIRRLRDTFVRLSPMPLGGTLGPAQMRSLVAWIAQGAKVAACP